VKGENQKILWLCEHQVHVHVSGTRRSTQIHASQASQTNDRAANLVQNAILNDETENMIA
jgi:hypothetical protein